MVKRMDDYVSKLQEDLRAKLDRLCWMHDEPAWHMGEHFIELRRQVDLDAERLLGEIQPATCEPEKARRDSDVNRTRLEFIRILEELEKRCAPQSKPQVDSSEAYASLEQRVEAFKDSSSSLEDLEESYIELAREIIAETDRVEKSILGEQTIIYWPHQNKSELGSLVYFGDIFLSRQQIDLLMSPESVEEQRGDNSLLVPVREPNVLNNSKQVITSLPKRPWSKFGDAYKFFFVGKSNEKYLGYTAEGSRVQRQFIGYGFSEYIRYISYLHIDGETFLDTSTNLFDHNLPIAPYTLHVRDLRLESLHANLLPSLVDRLNTLELVGVHLDSIDTDLFAKYTNLAYLRLQITFSKQVKFDLAFLGALRRLVYLELSLPRSPSDMSVLLQLSKLRELKLEGSSFFYAEKLPRLSKVVLEQILSPPRLTTLELSCFDIEAIDQDMLSKCSRLETLTLAKNRIDRTIENGFLNLGFPLCFGDSQMREERAYIFICKLIHSDIQALSPASFTGMTHLRELSLSGNSITDLPPGVFQDLLSLEELDLSKNLIRRIRSGVFGQLDRLWTLKLDHNPIESIEANAFAKLNQLAELSLNGCRLKSIDSEMFTGLRNLNELRLNRNLIERIEVVADDGLRINVAKADLNNEEKELIKKHLFKDLFGLNWLRLSGNKLVKLDLNCLSNLNDLSWLDVSSNMINELSGEIRSDLLPELGELVLTDNQLTTIDQRALPETLSRLFISKNRLKRLDEDFFVKFKKLIHLNLSENKLTMTITDATFASCRHCLEEIDLSQNESIRITEEAFAQMPHLIRIDFDFSERVPILPHCKKLGIRRLTPAALQALQKLCIDQPIQNLDKLEVCCLSNGSIKYLIRKLEWENKPETLETDNFNLLSWLAKASRLKELNFSGNLIETLDDPELFADFKDLTMINLSNNGLTCIHRDIFKCLSYLVNIDLSGNKLTSIDMGLFRHLSTNLTRLNLSSNNISFITLARLFRVCPKLCYLNLADNQLDDRSTAEPIDGRSSNYLETLVLANNRLEKMDMVQDMTNLKHLDLRGNRIESVMSLSGENLLGRLRKLAHLDLSGNQIRLLRDEMFVHLRGGHLNLSKNPADFELNSVLSELI